MPASPKATNFMNVKRRVIMKTASGKYIVKTEKGVKYAPKAKYYKNPAGSTVNVKYAHANVTIPSPIRPKLIRKTRKNYGEPRGKYAARVPGVRVHTSSARRTSVRCSRVTRPSAVSAGRARCASSAQAPTWVWRPCSAAASRARTPA